MSTRRIPKSFCRQAYFAQNTNLYPSSELANRRQVEPKIETTRSRSMTINSNWCEYEPIAVGSDVANVLGDSGPEQAFSVYKVIEFRLAQSLLPQNLLFNLGQILSNQTRDSVVQAITECLRTHVCAKLRSLSVEYSDGVVTLCGEVTTYYHKQVAQESVRRIAGVVTIVNLVDVRVANPVTGFSQSSNQGNVIDGNS